MSNEKHTGGPGPKYDPAKKTEGVGPHPGDAGMPVSSKGTNPHRWRGNRRQRKNARLMLLIDENKALRDVARQAGSIDAYMHGVAEAAEQSGRNWDLIQGVKTLAKWTLALSVMNVTAVLVVVVPGALF